MTEFADLTPLAFDPCTPTIPTSDTYRTFGLRPVRPQAGDTMTGNLIINANLQVSGDAGIGDDLIVGDDVTVGGDIGVTGIGTFGVSVNTPLVTTTTVNASGPSTADLIATRPAETWRRTSPATSRPSPTST